MTTPIDNLKAKIKKLLTLARDNGATEGEANAAMDRAMQLMTEHQLSQAECEATDTSKQSPINQETFSADSDARWQQTVWTHTARLYLCKCWGSGSWRNINDKKVRRFTLIGEETNILLTESMARYFCDSIERMAKAECRGMGRSYFNSFKVGASQRLAERLIDRLKQAQTETFKASTGTSLVLADTYRKNTARLNDYMVSQGIELVSARPQRVRFNGYGAGRDAGSRINIDTQMGGKRTAQLV